MKTTTFLFAILLTGRLVPAQIFGTTANTVSVTGDAEIKVAPDQVVMNLGVEVHSRLLDDARKENDRRVRAVVATAKRLGIGDQDVQTDFIQLGIQYANDGVTPSYYYTRKSIVLILHDVDRMEEVLAAAVDAGVTHIHGVEFQTTRLRECRDQARALAVKAAGEKAHDLAAAAGLKVVGGPVSISSAQYGGVSWYGSGWYGGSHGMAAQNVMLNAGGDSGGSQGTIALGRISVSASVSLQYRIE
ncbi:MAG TPA: SIMPL domain-containing protein [Bryobacteraceae bacterium]|nr:SIMPL domain-containing protein [Bryobacteraceae bacterium]